MLRKRMAMAFFTFSLTSAMLMLHARGLSIVSAQGTASQTVAVSFAGD